MMVVTETFRKVLALYLIYRKEKNAVTIIICSAMLVNKLNIITLKRRKP